MSEIGVNTFLWTTEWKDGKNGESLLRKIKIMGSENADISKEIIVKIFERYIV